MGTVIESWGARLASKIGDSTAIATVIQS